jgi:hypothetical protein
MAGNATTALEEAQAAYAASAGHTEQVCANCAIATALLVGGRIADAVERFDQLYKDIELPPGHQNVKGATAIEAFWRSAIAGAERVRLTTEDVA